MKEENLYEQALEMVEHLTNHQGTLNDFEREAARQSIQEAYERGNNEERAHLLELKQKLKDQNLLR